MAMPRPGSPYGDNGANGDIGDSMAAMVIHWRPIGGQWRQWITNGDNGADGSPMVTMDRQWCFNGDNGDPLA